MVDKVANVSTVPGVNPITAQIPNYVLAQLQNQRQQQMAAALMQQGTSPLEYDNRGRASWAQSLAKVLQTGLGMSLGNGAMGQQASLAQQGMQAQGQAYGMGQPSASQSALGQGAQQGSVGPTNENAARLAAALSPAQKQGVAGAVMATPYNPQGLPPEMLVNADYGSPTATAQRDALLKNLELTPEVKNNTWQGIQPETARAITISDATNKGFHGFTPGEPWTNTLTGAGGFAPKLPENAQPNAPFTPGSPIPSVGAVPGAIPVAARTSGATAGADASARLPYQTTTVLDTKNIPTLTTMGGIGRWRSGVGVKLARLLGWRREPELPLAAGTGTEVIAPFCRRLLFDCLLFSLI